MTGEPLPAPATVTVSVLNGTGAYNQATDTGAALHALGFQIAGVGDSPPVGCRGRDRRLLRPQDRGRPGRGPGRGPLDDRRRHHRPRADHRRRGGHRRHRHPVRGRSASSAAPARTDRGPAPAATSPATTAPAASASRLQRALPDRSPLPPLRLRPVGSALVHPDPGEKVLAVTEVASQEPMCSAGTWPSRPAW